MLTAASGSASTLLCAAAQLHAGGVAAPSCTLQVQAATRELLQAVASALAASHADVTSSVAPKLRELLAAGGVAKCDRLLEVRAPCQHASCTPPAASNEACVSARHRAGSSTARHKQGPKRLLKLGNSCWRPSAPGCGVLRGAGSSSRHLCGRRKRAARVDRGRLQPDAPAVSFGGH